MNGPFPSLAALHRELRSARVLAVRGSKGRQGLGSVKEVEKEEIVGDSPAADRPVVEVGPEVEETAPNVPEGLLHVDEEVYELTHNTGSYLYMAPEVGLLRAELVWGAADRWMQARVQGVPAQGARVNQIGSKPTFCSCELLSGVPSKAGSRLASTSWSQTKPLVHLSLGSSTIIVGFSVQTQDLVRRTMPRLTSTTVQSFVEYLVVCWSRLFTRSAISLVVLSVDLAVLH